MGAEARAEMGAEARAEMGAKRKPQVSFSHKSKRPYRGPYRVPYRVPDESDEEKDVDDIPPLETQAQVRSGLGGTEAFRAVKDGDDTQWLKVNPLAPQESLGLDDPADLVQLLVYKPYTTYHFYPADGTDQRDTYSDGKLEVNSHNILEFGPLGEYVTDLVIRQLHEGEEPISIERLLETFPNLKSVSMNKDVEDAFFPNFKNVAIIAP